MRLSMRLGESEFLRGFRAGRRSASSGFGRSDRPFVRSSISAPARRMNGMGGMRCRYDILTFNGETLRGLGWLVTGGELHLSDGSNIDLADAEDFYMDDRCANMLADGCDITLEF